MRESPFHPLSFVRIAALTTNTFKELTRLKTFYVVLIFALLLIGNSFFMAQWTFQQEFQVLKDIALGSMSIFTSLLAVVTTACLLPRDLEDRTVYTILAKPVRRLEYLLGKLAGVLLLLALSVLIMSALFLFVLSLREQIVLRETVRQMSAAPSDQLAEALRVVRASALNANLFPGIAIIYLKACLLASLTLFVSTFATSSIFTTLVMVFAYLIGHVQAIAREYWLQANGANWLSHLFFAFVTLFFPDLQLFNLADDIVAGTTIPATLLLKTTLLGSFYTGFYLVLAWTVFYRREL